MKKPFFLLSMFLAAHTVSLSGAPLITTPSVPTQESIVYNEYNGEIANCGQDECLPVYVDPCPTPCPPPMPHACSPCASACGTSCGISASAIAVAVAAAAAAGALILFNSNHHHQH